MFYWNEMLTWWLPGCNGSKLFDTLMVFLKESFEIVILKSIGRRQKKHAKFSKLERVHTIVAV